MWFQFCFSIVFVHVLGTISAKHDSEIANRAAEAEAIFVNVIKNISRVNNVLQDLINNYEHLQKIYKSQENFENVSSDDEVDEVFKSKKKRVRSNTDATTRKEPDYMPATQLVWSEDETRSSSGENNSGSIKAEKKSKETQVSNILEIKGTVKKESASPSKEETEDSDRKPHQKKSKKPAIVKENNEQSKKAKIIFIDTHKTTPSVVKIKQNEETDVSDHQSSKPQKERHSKISKVKQEIKEQRQEKEKQTDKQAFRVNRSDTNKSKNKAHSKKKLQTQASKNNAEKNRKVEKKLHSESFSPQDIWGEIINNKPIQLEAHNEVIFQKMRKDNRNIKKPLRNEEKRNPKTALVIVTNKNKEENITKDNEEIASSDEEFIKDVFQARVLREAYGDACLKVMIRKCYKACKAVRKSVCIRFTCKSTAKEKFDHSSKIGCLREFKKHNTRNNHTSNVNITSSSEIESGDIYENKSTDDEGWSLKIKHSKEYKHRAEDDDLLNDMTRGGYLEACLPHVQEELLTRIDTEPKLEPASLFPKDGKNFNILRDRYEHACKKMSYEKCKAACQFAYHETCEAYTCNKSKKKAYKKACKNKCKSAYRLSHDSSSSSSDKSDSSSSNSDSSSSDW